jgi:hypothetical protein
MHSMRRLTWRHLRTLRACSDPARWAVQWRGYPHHHGRGVRP